MHLNTDTINEKRPSMLAIFLKEIRIEHTFFALPFAYTGAVFGSRGHLTIAQIVWITLAVLGARTAAMAANRLFDRKIDARNPRTERRATATGVLSPRVMGGAIAIGLLLTLLSAYMLNPLCVWLLPIAAFGIVLYPLCKRFTWMTHFVLGAVDGFAPLGAVAAVSGTLSVPGALLFLAVTVWVAGFDILYALMDLPVDIEQGIYSVPARFGESFAKTAPIVLHVLMLGFLVCAGYLAHIGAGYAISIIAVIALIIYEYRLIAEHANVFALNERIFNANMIFSVVFLLGTIAGFARIPGFEGAA